MAKSGMPWESGSTEGKYQYHPGGDTSLAPKDAPSAINVVVIPDVNLPKVRNDRLILHSVSGLTIEIAPSREVQQMGQGRLLDAKEV
jgi:hypothetical protein